MGALIATHHSSRRMNKTLLLVVSAIALATAVQPDVSVPADAFTEAAQLVQSMQKQGQDDNACPQLSKKRKEIWTLVQTAITPGNPESLLPRRCATTPRTQSTTPKRHSILQTQRLSPSAPSRSTPSSPEIAACSSRPLHTPAPSRHKRLPSKPWIKPLVPLRLPRKVSQLLLPKPRKTCRTASARSTTTTRIPSPKPTATQRRPTRLAGPRQHTSSASSRAHQPATVQCQASPR